jgi:para-aminobenzoate synthetase component 1
MIAEATKPVLCRVHIRPCGDSVSLNALSRIISRQPRPAILGGNHSVERYSLFCAEPADVFQFHDGQDEPFEKLQQALETYRLDNQTVCGKLPLPGWIGYFAYPLAHYIERLPNPAKNDIPLPLIYLAFYDKAIVYDHKSQAYSLVVLDYPGQMQTAEEKFHKLHTWIDAAIGLITGLQLLRKPKADEVDGQNRVSPIHLTAFGGCHPSGKPTGATGGSFEQFTTNMTQKYYFEALRKIKQYILDGDVYQINFSQRFECDFTADPAEYFLWQNRHNPAPYTAYLSTANFSIVSASPELFLQIEGDSILTRPIKGTRPRRANDENYNRLQFEDLLSNPKDRAELMMIVDLERNDLARVCVPGSRHVRSLRTIEAWPTLFHACAEIAGRLPRTNDPAMACEILRAVFPGGSITGAPKIRAMEIVSQLEPTGRGIYTGCIGHIGIDFRTTLNIAIRTAVICNQKAYVQTGGGIVADSEPQAEWEEMQLKADALLAGLTAIDTF